MNTALTTMATIAKHFGFTDIQESNGNSLRIYTTLKHTKSYIRFYNWNETNDVSACIHGDATKHPVTTNYNINDKHDIILFKARCRRIQKMLNAMDDDASLVVDGDMMRYNKIANRLVENQIAFALQIKKSNYSGEAVIRVNGYPLRVDDNLTTRIRVSSNSSRVDIRTAMEIVAMMPAYDNDV